MLMKRIKHKIPRPLVVESMEPPEDTGATAPSAPSAPSASHSSFIKDGAITGVLPAAEAFAIHYPGYPSSTDRAVETLGGLPEIVKVRKSESSKLELRFRPEDPYCHPAFGELRPTAGLLLRIRKFKGTSSSSDRKGGDVDGRQDGAPHHAEKLSADVVARLKNAYYFDGMADYQHVPAVHAAKARRKKRSRESDNDPQVDDANFVDQSDVLMLVPPLFSPKDKPEKIVLNPPPNLFSKNIQEGITKTSWEMEFEPCLAIAFDIEKIPKKINWEDNIPKDSSEWQYQNALSKLFEERPIWPRWSLRQRLLDDNHQISKELMNRLLLRAAYYFTSGPFGRFRIRKGYDPRSDPDSRIYQKVEFRIQSPLRNLCNENSNTESKQTWKEICGFEAWPSKTFLCLQLFELDDDFIQQEIRKPTTQTTCTHSTGWLSEPLLRMLMIQVKIRFLSLYPDRAAEYLDFNRGLLERYKRIEALSRHENEAKEDQIVNRDSNPCDDLRTTGSSEPELVDHDATDNSELEDDEEEEVELDVHEPAPMAYEDSFFPVDNNNYDIREGIQNDYLQELLRGFPFNKGDDGRLNDFPEGADLDDAEYQIYEQESDRNDSDD